MLKKIYIALAIAAGVCSLFLFDGWNKLWAIAVSIISLAAFIALHFIYALISSLFLKKEPAEKADCFCRWFLEQSCDIILSLCRVRMSVNGADNVPTDRRFLFVCNHRSNLDPLVMLSCFKGLNLAFICKPEVFQIPAAGPYLRRCGFSAIDRENARNALVTINNSAEMLKGGEYSIGVYPEGTRSKEGVLLPFHDGVFKIAQKAGVPVVVATVDGTEKVKRRAPLLPTDVCLSIIGVIENDSSVRIRSHDLADTAKKMMNSVLSV